MLLYINACVRGEGSRTDALAKKLLAKLGDYTEVCLEQERIPPLDAHSLAKRDALIASGDREDPMLRYALQFARADTIVIAAPYWDLGFPACLKAYLENIYVTGITSQYSPEGIPVGLCRAGELYYVTTAGGPYMPQFSYEYIRALATGAFGIPRTTLIKAEMLDIVGSDPLEILSRAAEEYGL